MRFLEEPVRIAIKPKRQYGEITANVVIDEVTNDTLTITKQPVQQGASISDHAFKEPTTFTTNILFRDNPGASLSKIYEDLLNLQISRVPFSITTPKRIYKSMLISSLSCTTDKTTENALRITASFQEVIIVNVSTTTVARANQSQPQTTEKTQQVGKKSALRTLLQGFGG